MKGATIAAALLLIVPSFINFFTPIYNYANPRLDGLPFFYWFQILMLFVSSAAYFGYTYIQGRRRAEYGIIEKAKEADLL